MKNNEKGRMTLNQLSAKLQISRTTLYNIMHEKGSYSEETKERVYEALEMYHFRMNNHARNLAKNQKYEIAFIGFYSKRFGYFFDEIQAGIERAIEAYEDDGLQITTRYSDREEPEQQVQDLIELENRGVSNFIVFCYHYEKVKEQIEHLIQTGKNVILFSRRIPSLHPMCSVGCDDYLSGRLMAELLRKFARAGNRVQLLISEHNHRDKLVVGERLKGFYDALEREGNPFDLLEPAWTPPVPEAEKSEIRNVIFQRRPDVILDFVCNLQETAGYLNEIGKGNTVLLGYDVYPEVVPYIKDSTIDAVIYQDLPSQSFKAVELMFEYICYGKRLEKEKYCLPLNVVFASNCEYFENL